MLVFNGLIEPYQNDRIRGRFVASPSGLLMEIGPSRRGGFSTWPEPALGFWEFQEGPVTKVEGCVIKPSLGDGTRVSLFRHGLLVLG